MSENKKYTEAQMKAAKDAWYAFGLKDGRDKLIQQLHDLLNIAYPDNSDD